MTDGGTAAPEPPWMPDVEVTPALAASLITEQFPTLADAPITTLATGWDNIAFLVDERWLFRFPRRAIAVAGVRREIEVLPRLAPLLPLPIPNPTFLGQPSDRYGWPFFGAALLPGRELADSDLPGSRRTAAAAPVGRFLRALHDPSLAAMPECARLPIDPMRRADARFRSGRAREVLARLERTGIWPPTKPDNDAAHEVARLLDQADLEGQAELEDPAEPAAIVTCHGDLHVRHLLVDDDGAATGVIDWGDLCRGDPSVDLGLAYLGFSGDARTALLTEYGHPITARQELAARTLAVSLAAYLAEYAADQARPTLLKEALAGLRRAVS